MADADGVLYLNTDGSTYDTILGVYDGAGTDFNNLTLLACDNNSGTNGLTSSLHLSVTRSNLYYVEIEGVNGASGTARLNYSLVIPARLTALGRTNNLNRVRVTGQAGGKFTLQASTDLVTWISLVTTNSATGIYDYVDAGSTNLPRRFYRAAGLP